MKHQIGLLSLLLLILSSCVSTETVEPGKTKESETVVINLKAEGNAASRAGQDYKLRYIAKIFEGQKLNSLGSNPVDRKEIIDGESDVNQIVFKVTPDKYYSILVFADYIPADSQPDEGLYKDYFYDTHTNAKTVTMRTTPGSNSNVVSAAFFNNDNYDCFFNYETILKNREEYTINMTLERITAQVKFQEKSEIEGETSIKVNKLGIRPIYAMDLSQSSPMAASEANKLFSDVNLADVAEITETNKDLFYFYTLADRQNSSQYVSIQFKVTQNGEDSENISIIEIPVKSNFRTLVKGEYLKDFSEPDLPDDDDPSTKEGDILLNLTTNTTWEQESLSK